MNSEEIATQRLKWYYKLLIVIGPAILTFLIRMLASISPFLIILNFVPLLLMIAAHITGYLTLQNRGYLKMASQYNIWFIITYCIYVGLFVLSVVLTLFLMNSYR